MCKKPIEKLEFLVWRCQNFNDFLDATPLKQLMIWGVVDDQVFLCYCDGAPLKELMIWVVINVASMNWDVRIPQASTLIVGKWSWG